MSADDRKPPPLPVAWARRIDDDARERWTLSADDDRGHSRRCRCGTCIEDRRERGGE